MISAWVHHNFYLTVVLEVTVLLGYLDLDSSNLSVQLLMGQGFQLPSVIELMI